MVSVTNRIKSITQPRGGYLNPKQMTITKFNDGIELFEETINPSLMGLVVDYLTRYSNGAKVEDAFRISIMGALVARELDKATDLLNKIEGIDKKSIENACKLVGYDVCYRAGPTYFVPVESIVADDKTIENIRTMVNRSITFIEKYGPITKDGFTFPGGYTAIVDTGDGDFLTEDTLWDFKVSKSEPKKEHTLQLIMYYLMGTHSKQPEFENIKKIGIFNPRLNIAYTYELSKIDSHIIKEIEKEVIGY